MELLCTDIAAPLLSQSYVYDTKALDKEKQSFFRLDVRDKACLVQF